MNNTALYAGSFDPLTKGHLDVIRQGLGLAGKLVIAIGVHPGKEPLFSFEEREKMIRQSVRDLQGGASERIEVISFDGLVVESAKKHGAWIMIRGLRDHVDLAYEMQMAGTNSQLAGEIQTVFLPSSPGLGHITGTLVRQIAKMGGDISPFVPKAVLSAMKAKFG